MAKSPFTLFRPEILNDIAEHASKLLPNESSREELHRNIQLLVQNSLAKLELVTRDEFEAQSAVLQKTRAKVDQLEQQVADLQKIIEQQ